MGTIILLYEDEGFSAQLQSKLEEEGNTIFQINNPIDLIDTAMVREPDLIIMDMNFKYIDGLYIIEKFISQKECEKIPIMVAASSNMPLFMVDSIEHGAKDFIAAPINQDLFLAKVNKLMGR